MPVTLLRSSRKLRPSLISGWWSSPVRSDVTLKVVVAPEVSTVALEEDDTSRTPVAETGIGIRGMGWCQTETGGGGSGGMETRVARRWWW